MGAAVGGEAMVGVEAKAMLEGVGAKAMVGVEAMVEGVEGVVVVLLKSLTRSQPK